MSTPGPWENRDGLVGRESDQADTWIHVCSVSSTKDLNYRREHPFADGTGEDNAELITNAPNMRAELDRKDALIQEMLEALKAVEPYTQTPRHRNCTCDWCSELRVVLDAVATAIAKAEGETT